MSSQTKQPAILPIPLALKVNRHIHLEKRESETRKATAAVTEGTRELKVLADTAQLLGPLLLLTLLIPVY
jgi:hypothetical protein